MLDDALVRVFTQRFATGEFDPASQVAYTTITKDQVESADHQKLAQQLAANSLVLLKNEPAVLPVDPATTSRVVVVGDLANTVTLGGYSGEPTVQVNAVQGIKNALPGRHRHLRRVWHVHHGDRGGRLRGHDADRGAGRRPRRRLRGHRPQRGGREQRPRAPSPCPATTSR